MNDSLNHIESKPVLIVEDDNNLRRLLCAFLLQENIPHLSVGTGAEAVQILKSTDISVVLLDWSLDGATDTNGAAILSHCKKVNPLMPVIVMSGMQYDVATDAFVRGADGFLPKPFNSVLLTSLILTWLKRVNNVSKALLPKTEEEILPLEHVKTSYIQHVVRLVGNNVSEAAKRLDVHRHTVSAALA